MTTPKLPPPPRIAQYRSGCSSAAARTRSPLASTISASSRLSIVSPHLRVRWPRPPPSVSPPTPVDAMMPLGVASPCGFVAASTSPHVQPPPTRTVRACGSTSTSRSSERSMTHAVVDAAEAGAVVAAAADGDRQVVLARERDRLGDVLRTRAARDQRRSLVEHRVVELARFVVAGIVRRRQLSGEAGQLTAGRAARCRDAHAVLRSVACCRDASRATFLPDPWISSRCATFARSSASCGRRAGEPGVEDLLEHRRATSCAARARARSRRSSAARRPRSPRRRTARRGRRRPCWPRSTRRCRSSSRRSPCSARPSATSRAAASDAHAQSSRSASLSAPCSSGSCPRRRTSSTTASATPVRSSAAIAIRIGGASLVRQQRARSLFAEPDRVVRAAVLGIDLRRVGEHEPGARACAAAGSGRRSRRSRSAARRARRGASARRTQARVERRVDRAQAGLVARRAARPRRARAARGRAAGSWRRRGSGGRRSAPARRSSCARSGRRTGARGRPRWSSSRG